MRNVWGKEILGSFRGIYPPPYEKFCHGILSAALRQHTVGSFLLLKSERLVIPFSSHLRVEILCLKLSFPAPGLLVKLIFGCFFIGIQ